VTCFTSSFDQLSQWRGYAADGYGYSVGFDTAHFVEIKPDTVVLNVLYDEEMQKQFCDELLRSGIVAMEQTLVGARIQPTPAAIAKLLVFAIKIAIPSFKHKGFAEECEVRMFIDTEYDAEAKNRLLYHERKGMLVPHIPLRWGEEKLPIREIIVGPNLDFDKAQWGLQRFLEQHGYMDVEIRRSSIPYLT